MHPRDKFVPTVQIYNVRFSRISTKFRELTTEVDFLHPEFVVLLRLEAGSYEGGDVLYKKKSYEIDTD